MSNMVIYYKSDHFLVRKVVKRDGLVEYAMCRPRGDHSAISQGPSLAVMVLTAAVLDTHHGGSFELPFRHDADRFAESIVQYFGEQRARDIAAMLFPDEVMFEVGDSFYAV